MYNENYNKTMEVEGILKHTDTDTYVRIGDDPQKCNANIYVAYNGDSYLKVYKEIQKIPNGAMVKATVEANGSRRIIKIRIVSNESNPSEPKTKKQNLIITGVLTKKLKNKFQLDNDKNKWIYCFDKIEEEINALALNSKISVEIKETQGKKYILLKAIRIIEEQENG